MKRILSRLRTEGRDLLELFLIPGLSAILPWRLCFTFYRCLLRRFKGLYRESAGESHAFAQTMGLASDEHQWNLERRLVTLVDHADLYLSRFRSDRWMKAHLDVEGQWPAPDQAGICCTFHWGAGMWGLRHARAAGLHAHPLVAPLRREHYPGRTLLYWYYRFRNTAVRAAVDSLPLDTRTSLRPALKALQAGEQVLAAIDVPSDQVAASESIRLLGQHARVPRGLRNRPVADTLCLGNVRC